MLQPVAFRPWDDFGFEKCVVKHSCESAGSIAPSCDTPCHEVLPGTAAGISEL